MMFLTRADRTRRSQHFGIVSSGLLSTDQFLNQDETFSTSLAPSNVWNSYQGKGDIVSLAYLLSLEQKSDMSLCEEESS